MPTNYYFQEPHTDIKKINIYNCDTHWKLHIQSTSHAAYTYHTLCSWCSISPEFKNVYFSRTIFEVKILFHQLVDTIWLLKAVMTSYLYPGSGRGSPHSPTQLSSNDVLSFQTTITIVLCQHCHLILSFKCLDQQTFTTLFYNPGQSQDVPAVEKHILIQS